MTPAQIMDAQQFIKKRMGEHGITIDFYGTTDNASRWLTIRAVIVSHKAQAKIFGRRATGSSETYREMFERISGEFLVEPTSEAKHGI